MKDLKRVNRVRALPRLWTLVALLGLAGCGDDDSAKTKADGGDSGASDASGGGGGKKHSDAGSMASACSEEDGGPGSGCDDGYACIGGECRVNVCGDGVKLTGKEECDDGNVAAGDGCDPGCRVEKPGGCGDGVLQKGEECDDGNVYDADACSNACTKNACGNARIDLDEECDDGNQVDDDDCSNACTENRCRNGRMDPGEECDDGNRINDDGCTNACKVVMCGNAKMEGKEECDDGNQVDADACSNKCTTNMCGNHRVDPGEACDGLACADDCKAMAADMCRPCEDMHCKNYASYFDLVAGCLLGTPNPADVPGADSPSFDGPKFMQECVDAVNCTREHNCGYASGALATECYCGSNASMGNSDMCIQNGPASDAPCANEWRTATHASTNADIILALQDTSVPSGWAFYLLKCDVEFCADVCVP